MEHSEQDRKINKTESNFKWLGLSGSLQHSPRRQLNYFNLLKFYLN